jgi:DNA transformation protein
MRRAMKTERLYVNLGASQTRKRLKGHGYGVKRVETAGKGRALIVHTATGRHREELHSLFADVLDRPLEDDTATEPS